MSAWSILVSHGAVLPRSPLPLATIISHWSPRAGNCYNRSTEDWEITEEESWNTGLITPLTVIYGCYQSSISLHALICNAEPEHVFVVWCFLPCLSVRPVFAGKSKQIILGHVLYCFSLRIICLILSTGRWVKTGEGRFIVSRKLEKLFRKHEQC